MELSKVKDLTPIATFIVIVCSVTKMITYYKNFNINIIDFITLPEIIFSFTDDIYNFLKVILIYVLWWVIDDAYSIWRKKEIRPQTDELVLSGKNFIRNLFLIIFTLQLIRGILGSICDTWTIRFLGNLLVYLAIIYVYLKGPSNHSYVKYLGLLIVFFFLVRNDAEFKAKNIKEGIITERVTINYQDKVVTSDTTFVYLGKTKNYSFFYNRQNETSTVYDNSKILKFEIRKVSRPKR